MRTRPLSFLLLLSLLASGCPGGDDDDSTDDDDDTADDDDTSDDDMEGCSIDDQWDAMLVRSQSADLAPTGFAMGDLDGDGTDDVIIGDDSPDSGVFVFRGPVAGEVDTSDLVAWFPGGEHRAGATVDAGRDLDGDGGDDLLVGAHWAEPAQTGAVYLFHGPVAGQIGAADADADATIAGTAPNDEAGEVAAFAGDVDGDGLEDVIVGLDRYGGTGQGAAFLMYAPFSGHTTLASADAVIAGDQENAYVGSGVAAAGDVDGDGFGDVLIGAHSDDEGGANAGAVYLMRGPLSGTLDVSAADLKLTAEQDSEHVGRRLAGAGDLDGDGYDDIVIGSPGHQVGDRDIGAAYVVYGGPAMPTGVVSLADADAKLFEQSGYDTGAGDSVAGVGDVDGDGRDDLMVSAYGESYLLLGPVESSQSWANADVRFTSPPENQGIWFGYLVGGGGDADGDGRNDVLIAAGIDDYGWTGAAFLYRCDADAR